ncbi:MAG TPA: amidase [Steroidobacteraceae bacterium]|nr:amidase [Steroidobacteraceae bacterium]
MLTASVIETADAIAAGRLTSRAATEACIARARALNPILNCVLRIDEDAALAAADAADRQQAQGRPLGPLHGVPLAHKDMFYRAGRSSSCGSAIAATRASRTTSTLLERLDAAGALEIGALNMAEFALGPTGHNAITGHCRNAWNPEYISGGSSSGSGSAVGAGIVPASLGSDTGGSVRLPAALNGVLGLKPTHGRLSRHGLMPLSYSIDTAGPIVRRARDAARLMDVLAGHDPADPTSSRRPVPAHESECLRGIDELKVGVPRNYFYDPVTEEVRTLIEASIAVLERQGARIVEIDVPDPHHLTELSRVIVYAEATSLHGVWLRERRDEYSPQVAVRAATGLAIPAAAYLEALCLRPRVVRGFVEQVFERCDVLHTPTLAIPVPTLAETDVGSGRAMWDIIAQMVHCTAPINYLGLPAVAVPAGFTANGLPASFQLIGRPFAEAQLLRVAHAYEEATDWHRRVPPSR